MRNMRHLSVSFALAAATLALAPLAGTARAGCNEIPEQAQTPWRGYLGAADTVFGRPDAPDGYALPDPRDVEVTSNFCNPTQLMGEDYVVVVVFKPPRGGAVHFAVLTAAADCSPIPPKDCARPNVTCVCGTDANLVVSPSLGKLRFRFPDTPFTGPATIAVMPYGKAFTLPWQLATQRCQDPGGPTGLFACVDEIFAVGSCGTGRGDLEPTFASFTALPPMNDWRKACTKSGWPWPFGDPDPQCEDEDVAVRFTVDAAGNALVPVSWEQILEKDSTGKEKNRVVEGRTNAPKAKGGTAEIDLPADALLASYMPSGAGWPENVEFHRDSQGGWLVLNGETDVSESVLRIARREPWGTECSGGANDGQACHPDDAAADCPGGGAMCVPRAQPAYFACENGSAAGHYCTRSGDCQGGQCTPGSACVATSGQPPPPSPLPKSSPPCLADADCSADEECGLGLFEFRDRLEGGVGPVVIEKAHYKARAKKYEPK